MSTLKKVNEVLIYNLLGIQYPLVPLCCCHFFWDKNATIFTPHQCMQPIVHNIVRFKSVFRFCFFLWIISNLFVYYSVGNGRKKMKGHKLCYANWFVWIVIKCFPKPFFKKQKWKMRNTNKNFKMRWNA